MPILRSFDTEGRHTQNEGCLSIPEFREPVSRARKVTIRAQDVTGKWFEKTGEDLLARAFLHETDHLNGKLYISHISALKRDFHEAQDSQADEGGGVVGSQTSGVGPLTSVLTNAG